MRFNAGVVVVLLSLLSSTGVESFSIAAPTTSILRTRTLSVSASASASLRLPVAAAPKTLLLPAPRRFTTKLYDASAAAAEPPPEEKVPTVSGEGTATIPNEIFNLVKGIVGAGVLSLPAGIAAFGNAPSAILPAVGLIALIGALSGYGFSLIGRVCSYTGGKSYPDAWSKSVGEDTAWIPAVSATFKTLGAVLAYSMILADTGKALAETAGFATTRTAAMLGITSFVVLPLCWLKNLSSLAPFSLVGSLGMAYTALAMGARYLGNAYAVRGGQFAVAKQLAPSFGTKGASSVLHPSSFILVCMLSTAYMAHFNAAKFFIELKDNTIERYNKVVSTSFGISIALFAAIASLGFLTFGENCSGLILNNYSTKDSLMSLSRIAVAISLVFSYPLAFQGARDGVLDLFNVENRSNSTLNGLTLVLLSMVTAVALKLKDVSFVLAMMGATLGNALIYVYPALMLRAAVKKMDSPSRGLRREVTLAMGSAGLGIGFGIIGAKMALQTLA